MQCQFLESHSPLERQWHLLRCAECRSAKRADAILARGIERLNAEPAPNDGLARTLAAMGLAPTADTPRSRQWSAKLRHRLLPAGTFTALATLGAAGWLYYIDIDPNLTIPTPAMPKDNAYTMFLKAVEAIPAPERTVVEQGSSRYSGQMQAALKNTPDKKQPAESRPPANAATNSATGAPAQGMMVGIANIEADPNHVWTVQEKEALLTKYHRAMDLARKGFAYSYQPPPIRSYSTMLPYLTDDRQLARAFVLEAQVSEARRDYGGAANSSLDAMELGTQITHGSAIVGALTGSACAAMGRASLWKLVDHLDAGQARSAARRMEHIIGMQVPYADSLQEEKWKELASLQEMLRDPRWRTSMGFALMGSETPQQIANAVIYVRLLGYSKSRILGDYARLRDQQIAAARKPYDSRAPVDLIMDAQALSDPVVAWLFPSFGGEQFQNMAGTQTQNALLAAALALRAYRVEHHAYPKRLTDLVPRYLSAPPLDPFTQGQPLRYRYGKLERVSVDGGQRWYPKLYSVGPDGKDDDGLPIRNNITPNREHNLRSRPGGADYKVDTLVYGIRPDSKGDIVAGINTIVRN